MKNENTPEWLKKVQNNSWEPEILISGITLTFLFILSKYIYNFFGLLVQEHSVRYVVGHNLYIAAVVLLTGLKVGFILHLILRGIWAGFVGLSYVFPNGVNYEKLRESEKGIVYNKPEFYVLKIEKSCSLLFSFIFSSITLIFSFSLGMIPYALLYVLGLDIFVVKKIILYVLLPIYLIFFAVWLTLASLKKTKNRVKEKTQNSLFNNTLTTYFTNIGIKKTIFIFLTYFIIIILISLPDIRKFDFKNKSTQPVAETAGLKVLNQEHYLNKRDTDLRISKAAINNFWINEHTLELFISYYEDDRYTIRNLISNSDTLSRYYKSAESTAINLSSVFKIFIDNIELKNLDWYLIEQAETNQKGFITKIKLDSLNYGYHELKLDKMYWINKKRNFKILESWDNIPFEYVKSEI